MKDLPYMFESITALKRDIADCSWSLIATQINAQYHTSYSGEAMRSWYRRQRAKTAPTSMAVEAPVSLSKPPISLPVGFDAPMHLEGGINLVIADLHCPYHDTQFLHDMLTSLVDTYSSIGRIIIAGDLFDLDGLSKYSKAHNIAKLETELELTGQVLVYLASFAPVYICKGNHDQRFFDKLDSQLSFKRLINAAVNGRVTKYPIETTERDYIFVNRDFVIGHLSTYSATPGKAAWRIAQKYKRNALVGHDHMTGIHTETSHDRYVGASIGCCADSSKFWYSERRLNSMPFMTKGYAIIEDDTFTLYNGQHEQYFERFRFNDSMYNCFKI